MIDKHLFARILVLVTSGIRNPVARQRAIHKEVALRGTVSVGELCELFDASAPTIRRDLDSLERESLVKRTYGGAEVRNIRRAELDFAVRETQNVEGKRAIARAAVKLIRPGDTLFLNDGSTMLALAREIAASNLELFVITPALNLANLMVESASLTVCLTGGFVSRKSLSVAGSYADAIIDRFNADLVFVSASGFSIEQGLSYVEPADAEMAGKLIAQSKRAIALMTGEKLGAAARVTAAPVSDINLLITDKIESEIKRRFEQCGLDVTEARVEVDSAAVDPQR